MPFVSGALIELLLARAGGGSGEGARRGEDSVDAVGIRIGELPEPLLCLLRVAAARPVVAARLAGARLKASRLLTDGELRVAWIAEPAVRAIDPELRALFNVNEPRDLGPPR